MIATHQVGDILAVRHSGRPALDGLYRLVSPVDVVDLAAGAADQTNPTPMRATFRLERMRSAVHRTSLASVERPSAIEWNPAKKATYGVPGTPIQSNRAWATGAINTGRGILTTTESRDGGWCEWVADAWRYYDGAATLWSLPGNDPAERVPAPGFHLPMKPDVIVGNYIMELWIPRAGTVLKLRQWSGPIIGGSWGPWRTIELYGLPQSVRGWTVTRNDPDRVSVTAERVADLARGCRITASIHRGSSHVELTIEGEPYALQCATAQNSTEADVGGIVWMREADGVRIMGDSDEGLAPDDLSPLRTRGIPLGDSARYGLALSTRGADEWAIWADQRSRPVWGQA